MVIFSFLFLRFTNINTIYKLCICTSSSLMLIDTQFSDAPFLGEKTLRHTKVPHECVKRFSSPVSPPPSHVHRPWSNATAENSMACLAPKPPLNLKRFLSNFFPKGITCPYWLILILFPHSYTYFIYLYMKCISIEENTNYYHESISSSYILVFLTFISEQCLKGKFKLGWSM